MTANVFLQVDLPAWGAEQRCLLQLDAHDTSAGVYAELARFPPEGSVALWADPRTPGTIMEQAPLPTVLLPYGLWVGLAILGLLACVLPSSSRLGQLVFLRVLPDHWRTRSLVLLLLILPILAFVWINREAYRRTLTAWTWPEAPLSQTPRGQIIEVGGRQGIFYYLRLDYAYSWGEKEYVSNQFAALPPVRANPFIPEMQKAAALRATMCRVNPRRPWEAQLQSTLGGTGLYLLATPLAWVFFTRLVHSQWVCGPRRFRRLRLLRRATSLDELSRPRRLGMRLVWWFDPEWEFAPPPRAT